MNKRSARRTSNLSSKQTKQMTTTTASCTMITTISTTEKMVGKRKSTASATDATESKRFKSSYHDLSIPSEHDTCTDETLSLYKRIYLKCFICSKRQYISAQATDSNVLHTHWLAHGGNVLMNIYDSEVDSILTRTVEFFKSSKPHTLEGKIQTVFILNSKEIRRSPIKNKPSSDTYIVLD